MLEEKDHAVQEGGHQNLSSQKSRQAHQHDREDHRVVLRAHIVDHQKGGFEKADGEGGHVQTERHLFRRERPRDGGEEGDESEEEAEVSHDDCEANEHQESGALVGDALDAHVLGEEEGGDPAPEALHHHEEGRVVEVKAHVDRVELADGVLAGEDLPPVVETEVLSLPRHEQYLEDDPKPRYPQDVPSREGLPGVALDVEDETRPHTNEHEPRNEESPQKERPVDPEGPAQDASEDEEVVAALEGKGDELPSGQRKGDLHY